MAFPSLWWHSTTSTWSTRSKNKLVSCSVSETELEAQHSAWMFLACVFKEKWKWSARSVSCSFSVCERVAKLWCLCRDQAKGISCSRERRPADPHPGQRDQTGVWNSMHLYLPRSCSFCLGLCFMMDLFKKKNKPYQVLLFFSHKIGVFSWCMEFSLTLFCFGW